MFSTSVSISTSSLAVAFLIAGLAVGVSQTERAEPTSPFSGLAAASVLDDRRPLEAGDTISFRIVEEPGPATQLQVSPGGDVELPLVGRVPVAGRTCRQVAAEAKRRLESTYYNKATVIIALEKSSELPVGVVYVTGQVMKQGPIPIPRGEEFTVSKAILHAGGFADFADKRRVRIVRREGGQEKPETQRVDVKEILERGRLEKDVVLQPGDYIFVPERLINF